MHRRRRPFCVKPCAPASFCMQSMGLKVIEFHVSAWLLYAYQLRLYGFLVFYLLTAVNWELQTAFYVSEQQLFMSLTAIGVIWKLEHRFYPVFLILSFYFFPPHISQKRPKRLEGETIYIRHSNLMLEVCIFSVYQFC